MGLQTNQTNRALRLLELTDGQSPVGREALLALKFDATYARDSDAADVVAAVLQQDWSDEEDLAAAARHLSQWDMSLAKESRHAALGALTVLREITADFTGKPAPEPGQAFREAVLWLETHHGRIDPEWGDVNRLVRGETSLPLDGGPDTLRAVYPEGLSDDGVLRDVAGDTWIALVEWDEEGGQTASVIHQFGSATLDESSPHYDDQAELFADKQWRAALLERHAVEANAERTYRPGQ
jgi:penicillin amidase/acyl-homoserine-lactone acylase